MNPLEILPTVKVVEPDGSFRIINKSDLTDDHVLHKSEQPSDEAIAPRRRGRPPKTREQDNEQ